MTGGRTGAVAHRLDIQGLRAIAVFAVVAFHAGIRLPGGFIGVDIFFVISGFVITAMLVREYQTYNRVRFGRFYLRRFKRLTPALALCVTVTALLSIPLLSPFASQENAAYAGIGAMLLAANFVIARTTGGYFAAPAASNPLLHTWSLSIEEQFYLVLPALLGLTWWLANHRRTDGDLRFGFRRASVLLGALAIASGVFVVIGLLAEELKPTDWHLGFYSPITRVWEFTAGALLALIPQEALARRYRARRIAGPVGLAILALALLTINGSTPWPGPMTLLPVLGTVALIFAGTPSPHHPDTLTSRLLSTTPMTKLGDWSYSVYLWHWPFIVFAGVLWPKLAWPVTIAALLSLFPAVASYHLLESPIRKDPTIVGKKLVIAIILTLVPPLLVTNGVLRGADAGWGIPQIQRFMAFVQPQHTGQTTGCTNRTPMGSQKDECTWHSELTGKPVYLVGDSHADHFIEGLIGAAQASERPLVSATTNGCPFIDMTFVDTRPKQEAANIACAKYVSESLAWLDNAAAGTVIISNADAYYGDPTFELGLPNGQLTADSDEKVQIMKSRLGLTISRLSDAGHQVIVVQSVPRWVGTDSWRPDSCPAAGIAADTCQATMSVESALSRQQEEREALRSSAVSAGGTVWDLWPILCPGDVCQTQAFDIVRYRDPTHITVAESERLAPFLADLLR